MANFELANDQVTTVPIHTANSAGVMEPAPAGDLFHAVSSNLASLNAVIGADATGGPAVVMNALVQGSPGITVTVTDDAGLQSFVLTVDIVADLTPTAIMLDVGGATHVAQPVPAAVGP